MHEKEGAPEETTVVYGVSETAVTMVRSDDGVGSFGARRLKGAGGRSLGAEEIELEVDVLLRMQNL
jgi:hypothetical protein